MRLAFVVVTLVVLLGAVSAFDASLPTNSLQPGLVETTATTTEDRFIDKLAAGAAKFGEKVQKVGKSVGQGIQNAANKVGKFLGAKQEDDDDDDGDDDNAAQGKLPNVADPSSGLKAAEQVVKADQKTGASPAQVKQDLAQLQAQREANLAAQKKAAQASLEANLMDAQNINDKASGGQKKFKAPGPGEHLPEADLMGEAPRTSLSSSDVDAIARAILKEKSEDCKKAKGGCKGGAKGKGGDAKPPSDEEKAAAEGAAQNAVDDHKKELKGEKPDPPAPAKAAGKDGKKLGASDKAALSKVETLLEQAKKLAKALSSAAGAAGGKAEAAADKSDKKKDAADTKKDAADTKKDAADTKKDAADTKKDGADTKKDAADTKKDAADTKKAGTKKDAADTKKDATTKKDSAKEDAPSSAGATGTAAGTGTGTGTGTASMRFKRIEAPMQTVYFAEQAEERAMRAISDI